MSDYLVSLIRTGVPIIVGALVSWLATLGLTLDETAQGGLIVFLTGLFQLIYYAVIRALEQRWPAIGKLLGTSKQPTYDGEVKSEASTATR